MIDMGDKGQVLVKGGHNKGVYLYAHWGGTRLVDDVRIALRMRARWDDACYLARIVFDEMTKDDAGDSGFGICTCEHGDIEHPLVVVDCDTQTVSLLSIDGVTKKSMSFEDFVEDDDIVMKSMMEVEW